MRFLRKSSIQRKLAVVVLCASCLGLSVTCLGFALYERSSYRAAMTSELSTLADTLGANMAAALALDDRQSARDILTALRAEPHIVAACLYDRHGEMFAEYRREGVGSEYQMPSWQADGAEFEPQSVTLYRSVLLRGKKVSAIAIVSDLSGLHAKTREYTEISIVVLLISVLAIWVVSSRLLRRLTEPILQLAGIAERVSAEENYALRAIPKSNDEVAMLILSFNQMLGRIQERDMELQEAKEDLEVRVQARTHELQREVAERIRAEEALTEERKMLRTLIDNVPDSMYVKDAECQFIVANIAVARQMGAKSPEELLGKTDFDFYPRDLATAFYEDEKRVIRSGKAEVNREEPALDAQGNASEALTTQVPLRDKNGKVTGLAGISRDITHLKKVQAEMQRAREVAEKASRAKSEFLANMSHEIRTPLNGIMGMTDLALDTELTREQREYLETVRSSSDSLLTVINDILDFSKIEAGKVDLEVADFDLRDSIETTLKAVAVQSDGKGLELLCDVAPEVPEIVRGDSARLRQVITNLVGNAIKFTHEGEVALKVQRESQDGLEDILHFTVTDTGIGIPADKQAMIFDPFAQADTSTTRKYGGTGLGLTISARLVRMMGGRIWVESEEGRGSQFHFTVRLGVADRKDIRVRGIAPPKILRGVRVLIVDDNRANLRILEGMLKRWEMKWVSVQSGDEAISQLVSAQKKGEAFGLILTDMHMPEMDGFALVERIRQMPELSAATIMMLTSAGHRGDAARCEKLGVSAYLLKPIRQSELREAIARVLGAREQEGRISLVTRFSLGDARNALEFLRVLVAEDNPVNQRLIVKLLEKRGHRVTLAGNGREAVEALQKGSFDVVLMDVQMPEMDGLEATAAIRVRENGTGTHIAIIALTAHAMKGDREKCLGAGMDGYLTKPIQPRELDKVLGKYLQHR